MGRRRGWFGLNCEDVWGREVCCVKVRLEVVNVGRDRGGPPGGHRVGEVEEGVGSGQGGSE